MSSYLKYLEKFEEKENDVLFHLKDYPSSHISGNKIVKELYIFFFHDETLQLNRVHKLDDLTYKIEKKQNYFCLNCKNPIFFDEDSNYITTCEKCNWRNELNDTPAIQPISIKTKTFENEGIQICYPFIDKSLLQYLPEKLREAVVQFLDDSNKLQKNQYDNLFNNIYDKDLNKLIKKSKIMNARIEFVKFFKTTNFLK